MNNVRGKRTPGGGGAEQTMWTLLQAAHVLEDRLEAALSKVDLSGAKLGVLTELVKAGEPLTLGDLASRIQCVRSNVTQLVDRLEAQGLVRRVDDPSDRRSVRAELTREGHARHAAGAKQMERIQGEFAAVLPAAERAALSRMLEAVKK